MKKIIIFLLIIFTVQQVLFAQEIDNDSMFEEEIIEETDIQAEDRPEETFIETRTMEWGGNFYSTFTSLWSWTDYPEFKELVKPDVNPQLSELAQSLTNVTQPQIEQDGVSFAEALERFVEFSRAASAIICMNRDSGVFRENCDINQLVFPFREDFHRLRPFLVAQGIDLDNISSGELHKLTSTPIVGHTHDALHDCRSMAVWLKHSREQGIFVSVSDLPIDSPGYPE